MKCITLKQPFASLIANGYKRIEFRSWKSSYRGDLLIHAGSDVDKEAMKRFEYLNLDYPQGAIIAKVKMVDCIEITDKVKEELKKEDPIVYKGAINHQGENEYGFVLEDIEKIDPIPTKGKLGLWNYK